MDTQSNRDTRAAEPLTMYEIVFPGDLNPNGVMFGGKLVALMDICTALCVSRWSRRPCVTASIDAIAFNSPIRHGQMVELTARVVYVGNTSCVAFCSVHAQDITTGDRFYCCEGYFTIVGLDSNSKPTLLPMIPVDSDSEKLEWEHAKLIKEQMLARRELRGKA